MGAVRELKRTQTAAVSPEREKLAARIEARAAGDKRLEVLAKVPDFERVVDARKAVEAARTVLNEALKGDVDDALDAAVSGEPAPEPTAPAARASLARAEAALVAATEARAQIANEVAILTREKDARATRVTDAVGEVVAADGAQAIETLLETFERQKRELADTGMALSLLMSVIPHRPGWTPIKRAAEHTWQALRAWQLSDKPSDHPLPRRWADAIEKLGTDADAPLPL